MVQLGARHGLSDDGIENPGQVYWNLTTPALYEEAARRHEGLIARADRSSSPPASTPAARRTTSSSSAKPSSDANIGWGTTQPADGRGAVRCAPPATCSPRSQGKELFVQDCYAGADPRLPAADPHHHRVRLAQPVLPQHVHRRPPRGCRAGAGRVHGHRRAELPGRSRGRTAPARVRS